jgi:hypothetical protein
MTVNDWRKRVLFLRNRRSRHGASFLHFVATKLALNADKLQFADEEVSLKVEDVKFATAMRSGVLSEPLLIKLTSLLNKAIENQEVYVVFNNHDFGAVRLMLFLVLDRIDRMITSDKVSIESIVLTSCNMSSRIIFDAVNTRSEGYIDVEDGDVYKWEIFLSGGWRDRIDEHDFVLGNLS